MTELSKDLEEAYRAGDKVPAGWQPYVEYTDQIGKAIVRLPNPNASAHDLLIGAGFNPDEWQIQGPIQARKWMSYDGRWLHYFKFDVVAGVSDEVNQADIENLTKHIRKRRPRLASKSTGGSDAWAFLASDWQIGKQEGGDGTPQTIDRVIQSIDMAVQQVKDLRRIGRRIPVGAFIGLGDLVEGCTGFYPAQRFLVDRTRRDQGRITRELITYGIDSLSPLFEEFKVATIGGNHGQNRDDGKAFTTTADNDDVAAFEAVREAYVRAGDPGIDWIIPDEELSLVLHLGGVGVGITHGDLFRTGATAQQKALKWWQGQDFGLQALRDAQILLSGHYHHASTVTYGSRTHHQTPAMDPGSAWWRQSTGDAAPAGAVTMRLDSAHSLGWDDYRILSPLA